MPANDDPASAPLGKTAPGPAPALVSGGDLPPGYVVGEYRVGQVLGRGGMGVVYAGVQPVIEKRVAIKVLNSELSSDPALVRRFLDEARAVNRIRHPNIIDIFSFGQLADSRQYFVMEYIEGHTLAERLQAGDLPHAELPPLLGQICDALDAAHGENIVHRDLKPENVWVVEPRRGRPFVKLLDFGIAKLLATGEQSTTQAGMLMGTPQYMSPEQCHGRGIDHRTDIYALGVILYQIYTGTMPFRGETFAEILTQQLTELPEAPSHHASMPTALDKLILRCLAKDANERPQSARELGEELARVLTPHSAPVATKMLGKTLVKPSSTTTLRGSAHGLERVAPEATPTRRWPLVLALLVAGLAAAGLAARLARPTPSPEGSAAGPASPPARAAAAPGFGVVELDAGAALATVPLPTPPAQSPAKPPERPATRDEQGPGKVKRGWPGTPPPSHPARTRASQSGLVTDNPFR